MCSSMKEEGARVLASVALVSQSLPPLPHVIALIQTHLDHSHRWTLETASRAGFLHLLGRLTAQENNSGVCSDFRLARFTSAVQKAAAQGRPLSVLQWWSSTYLVGQDLLPLVLGIAAESGQLGVIQWLLDQQNLAEEQPELAPVLCNHRATLFWLHEHVPWLPLKVSMDAMAKQRDLELMQWAHERRRVIAIECTPEATATAAEGGHLAMLQWLHSHYRHVGCSELALSYAAGNGHLEIVQWLDAQYSEAMTFTEPDVMAVRRGYDAVIKWIIERFRWRDEAARASWASWAIALSCRLEMVQYLLPYCDADARSDMLRTTIYWGRLDIVQWLHEQQVEWFDGAIEAAAESGRLEILQWLHDNRNDECSTYAMYGAATNNQLAVMLWLQENRTEGCTTAAMDTAAANGHLEMVQWLHDNRSEGCTTYAMDSAVRGHYLEVVQWLHDHRSEGCTTRAMDAAARSGDLEMLQWLHENRTEGCTVKAMDLAAANGHLQIVRWLHANRSEGCSLNAVDCAAARGHLQVVKFLMLECELQCSLGAIDEAFKRGHFHVVEWLMHHDPDQFLDMSKWRSVRQVEP